jgi:hypothetical protein
MADYGTQDDRDLAQLKAERGRVEEVYGALLGESRRWRSLLAPGDRLPLDIGSDYYEHMEELGNLALNADLGFAAFVLDRLRLRDCEGLNLLGVMLCSMSRALQVESEQSEG